MREATEERKATNEETYETIDSWAARYDTWLLIELTPNGNFFPFLFLRKQTTYSLSEDVQGHGLLAIILHQLYSLQIHCTGFLHRS